METTKTDLIEECRRGKREAQRKFYETYAPWLYRVCLRILPNPAEAEEAMQDSLMKILTHLEQIEEAGALEGWMKRVAVHTAIDYARRRTEEWDEIPETYAAIDEDFSQEEEESAHYTVEHIKACLGELPAGYRVVLSLYLFEGYDVEEIASILHVQPASVRSQYLRGKRKLLEIMKQHRIVWTN